MIELVLIENKNVGEGLLFEVNLGRGFGSWVSKVVFFNSSQAQRSVFEEQGADNLTRLS